MEDGQLNSSTASLPPFLTKTYEMIDDPSTNSIISWGGNNKSFIVWDEPEFSKSLLPTFFKHSNFSSFIRQLNTYGFRKTDPVQWEFANEDFVRDQPHLMLNIHRRRPVHSHSSQNQNGQIGLSISEREEYKDEIEGLRSDRESLLRDIRKVDDDHKELEVEMEILRDDLLERQKINESFTSRLAQALRRPQSVIHEWKSRSGDEDEGDVDSSSPMQSAEELLGMVESSVNFWEGVFDEFCTGFMENAHLDLNESEEEEDDGSPANVSCIDMNCEAVGDESVAGCMEEEEEEDGEQEQVVVGKLSSVANDGFWEQFLTENPGSVKDTEPNNEEEGMELRLWWDFKNIKSIPPAST